MLATAVLLGALVLLAACGAPSVAETFVTGLNQPRGMAFDNDGNLLVTEAGALDPSAPRTNERQTNSSSRIVRIAPNGQITPVLAHVPFTYYVAAGDIGAADIVRLGDAWYILTGEGSDEQLSRMVMRLEPDGSPQPIADLRRFALATRPLAEQMIGVAPSNPDAMIAAPDGRALYVADGASGRILRVTPAGDISIAAELPNQPPMTGMAFGPDGKLYATMFSRRPHTPGSGQIWTLDSAGAFVVAVNDLTMPIAVRFDAVGTMYVLEFSSGLKPGDPYAPHAGRLLRIGHAGTRTTVLDQLNYPTAMLFSATGDLYITENGAFSRRGQGTILKIACRALGIPNACQVR